MKQLPELANDPFKTTTAQGKYSRQCIFRYFKGIIHPHYHILDIGQRSPLTEILIAEFGMTIDNTDGDLDTDFAIPGAKYEFVIFSHTIEHLFSPLNALLRIKEVMSKDCALYIILPDRKLKILWCAGHYHEIDTYRMKLLLKRAGLKLVSITKRKAWRHWTAYLKGFRPLLRLLFEYNAIYEVRNDDVHLTKEGNEIIANRIYEAINQE